MLMRGYSVYSLIVFLLCVANSLVAQKYTSNSGKAVKQFEEARSKYRMYLFAEAETGFLKAIKTDPEFIEAYIVLAKMYWDIDSLQKAIDTYDRGLKINPSFYTKGYFFKGDLERKTGQYDAAVKSLKKLLEVEKNSKVLALGKQALKQAEYAVEAVKNPVDFNPVLLDTSINSADDEYWPSLSADEQTIVITRLVNSSIPKARVQEDFYISTKVDSSWSMARNAGKPLNTYDNEGAQSISANGATMVYTVCNRRGVIGRCDLYVSEKRGTAWTEPQNLGLPVNSKAKETQPSLSADGNTLYFSSDRAGGKGGLDIWVSHKTADGLWSNPENLGDSINTRGNESSPFIHHDNSTLYFSSDYHLGMGGFDIFYSRKGADGKWNKPINIGYPINTHRDEIGLVITAKGDRAYYSSNINPERGRDIYQFDLYKEARPMEVSYMKGKVFDANNRKVLRAEFELFDLETGKNVSKSYSDPYNGEFLVCIPTDKNYMLNVSKEGYLFFSENFSMKGIHEVTEPLFKDVPLYPILSGRSIVLNNIFYETDSYELKKESYVELNKLVKFLEKNNTLKIELGGHTDNVGSEEYNKDLSRKRAESVVSFLVDSGIKEERLISKGYGFSKPIDTNDTKVGRAKNRRTELLIIE